MSDSHALFELSTSSNASSSSSSSNQMDIPSEPPLVAQSQSASLPVSQLVSGAVLEEGARPAMVIAWSSIEAAATSAITGALEGHSVPALSSNISKQHYRMDNIRPPRGDREKWAIGELEKQWPKQAMDALELSVAIELQCQDPASKQLGTVSYGQEVRSGHRITALVCKESGGTSSGRVQIVVGPEHTGFALADALNNLLKGGLNQIVNKWKVLTPELASSGPDSAVLYLNVPITDPLVGKLVTTLHSGLAEKLEPLQRMPLGMMQLGPGIYGTQLLTSSQYTKMDIGKEGQGSWGAIASRAIACAAFDSANKIRERAGGDEKKLDRYLKDPVFVGKYMQGYLQKQLNWQITGL